MNEFQINNIKGYELCNDYTITKEGKVYSYKSGYKKEMKGSIDDKGYPYVDLTQSNGKRKCPKTHRLIALAFISNPEGKPQINHIDGNKRNNKISNLEWVTQSENVKHSYLTGLNNPNTYSKGSKNYQWNGRHKNCKKVKQLTLNNKVIRIYNSIAIANRAINSKSQSGISAVCNGRLKTYYGFKWEFVD